MSAIDKLLSAFIIPLQGDNISTPDPDGKGHRVHCSLNINTGVRGCGWVGGCSCMWLCVRLCGSECVSVSLFVCVGVGVGGCVGGCACVCVLSNAY